MRRSPAAPRTGMAGAAFHVYRGRKLIATVTDSTNYLDAGRYGRRRYRVVAVVRGREKRPQPDGRRPGPQTYRDLPLQKPADGVTPAGEAYTYAANDMSVGDVDGDGTYEYVVKWDPSNSKDVSQVGYTGPVSLDTYRADGTLLHRIDLGVNIRAGAHYTQFLVYDFDGDGRSEMMLKTAPGTKTTRYDSRRPSRLRALHHHAAAGPSSRLLPRRRLPAEQGRLLRPPGRDVPGLARPPGGGGRTLAGHARGGVRHRADGTTTRCPRPTRRRWPTTSSTSTPRPQRSQPAAQLRGLHRRRPGVPHRVRRPPPVASCRPSTTSPAGMTTA